MEAVSRGAKMVGAMTYGVTAEFFAARAKRGSTKKFAWMTWQQRLFELIRIGDGFVACKGGTGTLARLRGLGNVEQGRDYREAVCGAGRFLGADSGAGARSGIGACVVVGRSERELAHSVATPTEAAEFLRPR